MIILALTDVVKLTRDLQHSAISVAFVLLKVIEHLVHVTNAEQFSLGHDVVLGTELQCFHRGLGVAVVRSDELALFVEQGKHGQVDFALGRQA